MRIKDLHGSAYRSLPSQLSPQKGGQRWLRQVSILWTVNWSSRPHTLQVRSIRYAKVSTSGTDASTAWTD